ncbi:MAG: hypothetical protein LBG27_00480, partial [Spirochaetaceae bacterium]|nr:hypothetical protein [Spirochaetaceae bacterium]
MAGITAAAVGANAAASVQGVTYWEMTDTYGIDDDIAWSHAGLVSAGTGVMEAALGGVASGALKNLFGLGFGGALNKAVSKWFVSGKMGLAGKALMDWASEVAEEGLTEGAETVFEGSVINMAAGKQRKRDIERLRGIYAGPIEETAAWLEAELEKHPEIARKEA